MIIADNLDSVVGKKVDPSAFHDQLQTRDAPPPYDGQRAAPQATAAASSSSDSTPLRESHPVFQPANAQCVNRLSIFSRHNAISGTYLIDPLLSDTFLNTGIFSDSTLRKVNKRDRSVERAHALNVRRAFGSIPGGDSDSDSEDKKIWRRRSARMPEVNAAFRTRHGAIKLDLAIVNSGVDKASQGDKKARGRVMLSSRKGRIHVDLHEIQPGRCVDLDVSTRASSITVFLPPTFNGAIAFHTRSGPSGVHFLPGFAQRARVVRGSDRDILVMLSSAAQRPDISSGAPTEDQDCCVIGTRWGTITIGLSGVDELSSGMRTGGLVAQFEAAMEAGAKQIETMLEAGARVIETTLIGRA